MTRAPFMIFAGLALCLALSGCFAGQKKQLALCEASATRTGDGEPLRSIQACMDKAGYSFVGYANTDGTALVCDLPAVIRGQTSPDGTSDAKCFQPKGALALRIYRMEVPVRNPS